MISPQRRIPLATTTATFLLILRLLSNSNISYAQSHQQRQRLLNSKRARIDNNNRRDGTRGNTSSNSSPKLTRAQHDTKKATKQQQSILQFYYPNTKVNKCQATNNYEDISSWLETQNSSGSSSGRSGYLYRNLKSCCETYFPNDIASCLDDDNNLSYESIHGSKPKLYNEQQHESTIDTVQQHQQQQQQRLLGKATKHSKKWSRPSRPSSWNSPSWYYQMTKSGKIAKAKSSKATTTSNNNWWGTIPYKPRQTPLPTRNPTRRPTYTSNIKPGEESLSITMGGKLTAKTNIQGTQDELTTLAKIAEQTLLRVLDNTFECMVYNFGDVIVGDGSYSSKGTTSSSSVFDRKLGGGAQLWKVDTEEDDEAVDVDVLFNCQTTQPCPSCSQTDAVILGSQIFEETFDLLEEEAKNGSLSTIFCIMVEMSSVELDGSCSVDISNVEGTSLQLELVDGVEPPPSPPSDSTPKPTMGYDTSQTSQPQPNDTLKPVMDPTTLPPILSVPKTTESPITPIPTELPVAKPTSSSPTVGSIMTATSSPTQEKTDSPSIAEVSNTISPTVGSEPDESVTNSPTISSEAAGGSSTAGPTITPQGATYYTGFEKGTFTQGYPDWTTSGDGEWEITNEYVNSGVYSIRSPILENEERIPKSSEVVFTTGEDWPEGTLILSILAGTQMPFDNVVYYVDDQQRGFLTEAEDPTFITQQIDLSPGQHEIKFEYNFNPVNIPEFPPEQPGRLGGVFIDDVYFLPSGVTLSPTGAATLPVTESPEGSTSTTIAPNALTIGIETPPTTSPTVLASIPASSVSESVSPTPAELPPSTASPTSLDQIISVPGAEYYNGFERATFPNDLEWTTSGDGMWTLTEERANTGKYSIKSPNLDNEEGTPLTSNVTLSTGPDWPAGRIYFSILGGVKMPFDDLNIYVDGTQQGRASEIPEFVNHQGILLSPGEHDITFSYRFNPAELENFPPPYDDRIGAVFLDDVYFLPAGVTLSPTSTPGDDTESPASSGSSVSPTPASTQSSSSSSSTVSSTSSTTSSPSSTSGTDTESPEGSTSTTMAPNALTIGIETPPTKAPVTTAPTIGSGPPPTRAPSYYPSYMPSKSPVSSSQESSPTTASPAGSEPTRAPSYYPSYVPTRAPVSGGAAIPLSTTAPTSIPADAIYYDGFEKATFPDEDPEWSTDESSGWELSTEQANSGVYSIRSPNLMTTEYTPKQSNVTLSYSDPAFEGGTLVLSILPGVQEPFDNLEYFVNGESRGVLLKPEEEGQYETLEISLTPGPQEVMFQYSYNPYELDALPPPPPTWMGAVYIDDAYILPSDSANLPATPAPESEGEEDFFDGFESGDFEASDWSFSGEEVWVVDDVKPYEGTYSAHVRSDEISSGEYSQLDLEVDLDSAAFIQFDFHAATAMPFESFDLRVDGQFLTGLSTDDDTWTQAGAVLSSGEHVVSWRMSRNPGGAPDDVLATLEQPPYRTGEAFIDNVQLISATPSFTEIFDSGDFTANPWILSGDGEWLITDAVVSEGANSATISNSDISENEGLADLSIDIITERGGTLSYEVLPSVSSPFEIANVLLDDIAVMTYSSTSEDWIEEEITIQPGKRKVTFQLQKNPGGVPEDVISGIPSPPGRDGVLWLDNIVFVANE